MSGHSKWAQIKRQKGVTDKKRGQAFTKLASAITIAVRQGGGVADPSQNFKLRLLVEKAREINMPKENIERAIARGKGGAKGKELQEVVYEGFGPGNTAIIVEAATDNKMRTSAEVKNIFDKSGGSFGSSGSVAYQFQTKGLITAKKEGKNIEDLFLLAADAGAQDVEDAVGEILIYTKPEDLAKVRDALTASLHIISVELIRQPTITVAISDKEKADKVLNLLDKLEELDDVQKVYANFDIPEELLEE